MEQKSRWKEKINGLFNTCQGELKRTTEIGKKMLSASKENSLLKENYEELGKLVFTAFAANEITLKDERSKKLCEEISLYLKKLDKIEQDVQDIKTSK